MLALKPSSFCFRCTLCISEHLALKFFERAFLARCFSPRLFTVSKGSVYFFLFSRQVWWQNSSAGFLQQECGMFHPLNKNNVTFAIFALAPHAPDT